MLEIFMILVETIAKTCECKSSQINPTLCKNFFG